jgi:hypothetical protein
MGRGSPRAARAGPLSKLSRIPIEVAANPSFAHDHSGQEQIMNRFFFLAAAAHPLATSPAAEQMLYWSDNTDDGSVRRAKSNPVVDPTDSCRPFPMDVPSGRLC